LDFHLPAPFSNVMVFLSSLSNLGKLILPPSAAPVGGALGIREVTAMADPNNSTTTAAQNQNGTEVPPRKRGGGARTEAGKANSRRNALKGSLRAKVVFTAEMAARIVERTRTFTEQYRPRDDHEKMLISDMAIAKAKLDRCQELAIEDYSRCVWRAFDFWDDDQKARALEIAKNLERQPERTVHALRQTKKGAELMISYWAGLAEAARTNGGWDEPQQRLAFDLLAVRVELRSGSTRLSPGGGDDGDGNKDALIALAQEQIAELEDRIEQVLEACHKSEQAEAISGMFYVEDATTKKLRKDESRARCDYNKAYGMLLAGRAEAEGAAGDKDKADGIPPVPPKASEAAFDYLFRRFQTMCRTPGVHTTDCDTGDEDADEREATATAPEQPHAEADSDSAPDEAGGESAAETETQTQTETEMPAAAPQRPMTRRARKLREKRLREAAKREKRMATMAR
jgi:hypothetical protein